MKNKVLMFLLLLSLFSCKSFFNHTEKEIEILSDNEEIRLSEIKLSDFTAFIRYVNRDYPSKCFYGTNNPNRFSEVNTNSELNPNPEKSEKLEQQYVLIAKVKNAKGQKKVIFISTIQPFKSGKKLSYDYPVFDKDEYININFFNFFKLGYLDENKSVITFYKDCCHKDYWHFKWKEDGSIHIRGLEFDYKTRFGEANKFYCLNQKTWMPIEYHPLNNFKFMINSDLESSPEGECSTEIEEENKIYFDEINKRMYFHFNTYFDYGNKYKWLYFKEDRVINHWID
ncbi:hypothetical protein [Chryseobacterium viscerum]|uniref:Lipoprotein n=1 Tax=Chryseobacterium viscerum TaxID=1037377 RepID=A0A5N4BS19_9FLAO|nr:hypothetical protein [Chryseobacterium viscerum]KAB1231219.1 hypothetical protein F8D52_09130 [Chryseobacterium viscerum]